MGMIIGAIRHSVGPLLLFTWLAILGACKPEGKLAMKGYMDLRPGMVETPPMLSFDNVLFYENSTQSIVLKNTGDADVKLGIISNAGLNLAAPFQLHSSTNCTSGKILRTQESCQLVVEFFPVGAGNYSRSLLLRYHDGGLQQQRSILLSGTGILSPPLVVTINQQTGQGDPTDVLSIVFDVAFSEPINGATFTIADITQNGTATGITWDIINSGDDQNFTLMAIAITGEGTVVPSLTASVVQDPAGNDNNASTSTDNSVRYSTFCPFNNDYVEVPGNASLGTADFCLMKYEAKNVGGIATSQAAGGPWVSINQINSKTACTALGAGYDLISNPEWMTLARDIETQNANWSNGSVGDGCLFRGNNGTNDTCGYDGADPESGTGRDAKAKHVLSSGEEIWDIAGNVAEWVDWTLGGVLTGVINTQKAYISAEGTPQDAWREFINLDTNISNGDLMELIAWQATDPALTSAQGIGGYWAGTSGSGGAARRGGSWFGGTGAGAFALNLNVASTSTTANAGFRCVYRPGPTQ